MKTSSKDLFTDYYPYAVAIAKKFSLKIKLPYFDVNDCIQSAIVGLIDAMNKYDESKGTKFKNYAFIRILGTIKDNLRKMSPVPRSIGKNVLYSRNTRSMSDIEDDIGYNEMQSLLGTYTIDIEAEIDRRRLVSKVQAVLWQLKPKKYYVMYQYYIKEKTLKDIGNDLGLAESTMYVHLQKAKIQFKKLWPNQVT